MADRPETKTVLTRTATVAAAKEGQNLAAATRVGRYMVLSKVGAGGMGEVYAAYDPKLDRRVALKVLHRMESAAGAERLLREARALARLSHPNVVTVHEVDELLEVDGQPLIAMEFVEGHTLKRWVGKATPTAEETVERLELLIQAGKGLVAAHEQGLVHRDFKPGNVLVGMDGRARVADFGLAVGVGESGVGSSGSPDDSLLETSLTETGTRVGTPAYMSPEQLAGRTVDARCDQFSFCVTAWEVLFGVRPYAGARLDGLLAAFRAEGLKRPADIEIPERVEAALRRGLSVRPGARFADMASLLEVLETELRILRKEQVRPASWRGWKVLGAVVLVSLGVFAVAKVREARRIAACETEGAAIGQLWDDDVRRTSLAALRSTPKGALVHDEDRLSPWLDAYVEELADAHVQACRHRSVEQDWDAELSEKAAWCLEERRDELEQEIGSYADGDPALSVVDRALAMSPVRPCLDSRALERLELPPPGSRAEVKSFKGELSASARLGDEALEERLTLVRDLKARASSVDWAPLQTELRRAEGGVLVDLGRATEGVAVLEKVWFESAESSRWEAAASIAAYLASIATLDNPDAEVARRWLALATVCLRQSYDPAGRLELRLVESQLSYETTFGDVKKAEKIARELLDGRRRIYGDAHVQVAAAQSWLAAVLSGQGRLEEAIALRKRAIETQLQTFGENRKRLVSDFQSQGQAQRWLGNLSEAKVNLEKAYEIGRRLTPDDPQLSLIVLGLAAGAWDDGDLDRAVELAEESLRMGRAGYGEDHPKTIDPLSSLADMKRMRGKKQEALNLYREAEKLGRETLGPKNLQTLYPRGRVCLLLAQIGARGEALEYCRSLASFLLEFEAEGVAGAGRVGLQRLLHLAWAFLELAAVEESLLWAAKAVEVSREVAGESSGAYAHAKVAQGRALALAGRLVEARDAVDFAIGMAEKITAGEAGDDLSDIWEGRAEVYVAAGEYDVALADYQEAIRRSGYEARIANYRAAVERLCREKNYEPACGAKSSR